MATQDVFSAEDLERLRGFPEINRAELIRYFTLTGADEAFVRQFRTGRNVLGVAVQLCTLPWLGFVPDDVAAAPAAVVGRLSQRLRIAMGELRGYGEREQTRTDHLREVAGYAGWRSMDTAEWKDLEEFLFARAMEHDSPKLLFRLACEYLLSSRVVRPGVILLLRRVAAARARARGETWARVRHLLTDRRCAELDLLLVPDAYLGRTPLAWLGVGPTSSSPAAVKAELEKLTYLRRLDAHTLDLSMLPAERRRFLAGVGRRLTGQALQRREPERRYPILLTLLAQSAVDVLDETLLLFDQAISGREAAAKQKVAEALAERAKGGENRQALLDEILTIVLDTGIGDEQIGTLLRGRIGMDRMRAAWAERRERLPRDHGQLSMLDASMSYLRQFAPAVLAAVQFAGGPGTEQLLQAVSVLAELYATGARKVPAGAPVGFVPTKWAGYLVATEQSGDVTAYRRYWEIAVLVGLRDGLRSGDVFVPGSRRYADPASFLLTPEAWATQKVEFCHLVGKPVEAADALAQADDELHTALADLETQLAKGNPGEVRLTDDGELIIPPLTAEDVPAEADALRAELAGMLPRVPIASALVEVDARTGFTDHLVHAGGKVNRPAELKRNLLYVIIAEATNMGLSAMAESCGVPYDVLAWTAEWYFRPETLEAANAAVVNYHHRLPLTRAFGSGTLSSSDGQRFPVKGKSITARHLSRYFARGQGVSTYTHVSDQHSTFDTKVIVATAPESHYVLDGLLGNATDLAVFEHATDTHGATLANFALFDLVGKQLSPRIRDLGKITLYRTGPNADFLARFPRAGGLLTRRLNTDLITSTWDDLLRVAASVQGGHATAALVVGKLCSSKRQQNALTSAIKEYGALRRTVYAARYLADETYRRRISRQLNKGENLHALRRSLAYAGEGALRRRHHEQQTEQMWCLTLATNAIVCWSTEYHGLAVGALRRDGRQVDDEVLAHIWPTHHENVHFYGTHSVDIDGELAQLDTDGYRPLRLAEAIPAHR
ncbi:Tn3 family transposase [Micromonospora chalcea]|uniref:Tn3 family transposase n=2 Tax=Micromonospora TaxID=1873 RepID=A0A420EQI0_9ACTN|nr:MULTISPECIES: Tn3 family transposase [Micromonospora]MBC8989600.1 Tn3 family transposase [Micromonospora chalcea]RKF22933.1 Tn3 family transposase [Micromonospora globbae]